MDLLYTALFADVAPYPSGTETASIILVLGGACAGSLFLLSVILYFLFRGRTKPAEPGSGLLEDLAVYPPPPKTNGRRLTVQGRPSRLRLIVVAPMGKRDLREFGETEDLLNRVVRGLGDLAKEDKARIRTWPPQLSNTGFAPTFFRNTLLPQDRSAAPHWSLVAGPAKAGAVPILLGIAAWSEEPSEPTQQAVEPHQWPEVVRVEP
jgi:hypothetical protein